MADGYETTLNSNMMLTTVNSEGFDNRNNTTARGATNRYRPKRISVAGRVERWMLYKQYNNCICDRCIANEIGVADLKKVAMATRKLALREPGFFIRWQGRCASCGRSKSVILARRLTWA